MMSLGDCGGFLESYWAGYSNMSSREVVTVMTASVCPRLLRFSKMSMVGVKPWRVLVESNGCSSNRVDVVKVG